MTRIRQWILGTPPAYRRFLQHHETARTSLGARKKTASSDEANSWIAEADSLLTLARARADKGDIEGAWHFLQAATRKETSALRGQDLQNRETMLRCEAEKISSKWRKCAIRELLDHKSSELSEVVRALRLRDAEGLLHDYFATQYYKSALLRYRMRSLMSISFVALVALLLLLGLSGTPISTWPEWDWKTLLLVLLFGVLGASFSATRKLSGEDSESRIPQMAAQGWVTVARTVLGATPALAMYAFIRADFINIVEPDTVKLLGFAFAAGFSERLVVRVLESRDGKQESKK